MRIHIFYNYNPFGLYKLYIKVMQIKIHKLQYYCMNAKYKSKINKNMFNTNLKQYLKP